MVIWADRGRVAKVCNYVLPVQLGRGIVLFPLFAAKEECNARWDIAAAHDKD